MVAIAGEISDRHRGVGDAIFDQLFNVIGIHRHGAGPEMRPELGRETAESPDDYAKFVPVTLLIFGGVAWCPAHWLPMHGPCRGPAFRPAGPGIQSVPIHKRL